MSRLERDQQSGAELVLRADRVVKCRADGRLEVGPAEIRVASGLIVEVCQLDRSAAPPPGARLIDLGDRLLAPAFVNGHTHLPMVAFRGLVGARPIETNLVEDVFFRLESGLDPAAIRAWARLGAYECLLSGTATVFEHYYAGLALAQGLRDAGLSAVVAPTLQDRAGPGRLELEAQIEATLALDEDPEFERAGIVPALGPHATDTVSAGLWGRIVDLAQARTLPLHSHLAQSWDEYRRSLVDYGLSPVEWLERLGALSLPHLMVHALFVSRRDLDLLDPDRHLLGYCPGSEADYAFVPDVARWTGASIPWVLGTDCAASNDSMDVQKQLVLVRSWPAVAVGASPEYRRFWSRPGLARARRVVELERRLRGEARAIFDPEFLLSRVWSVPGRFHPKLRCGSIEPGARAHLVVYDLSHPSFWPCPDPLQALCRVDAAPAIEWMLVNGEPVGERGRFHQSVLESEGYRQARDEAERRLQEHLDRIGVGPA